jgi:hypothetical protein
MFKKDQLEGPLPSKGASRWAITHKKDDDTIKKDHIMINTINTFKKNRPQRATTLN